MNNNMISKGSFFSGVQLDSITDNPWVIIVPLGFYAIGQICSLASKAIDNNYNFKLKASEIELALEKDTDQDG